MDGVTDFAFRQMVVKYGAPSLVMTEFVPVEALAHSAERALQAFLYSNNERPIVAQVYGIDVAAFKTAAQIACALGFDGLDINMGCPAKKVSRRGAGAALISNHKLAEQIIQACKDGIDEWANGLPLSELPVKEKIKTWIKKRQQILKLKDEDTRRVIPLSVKTRIGFDQPDIENWARFLATQELAAISIHGRTLKQLYKGESNWQEIEKGAKIIHQYSESLVLGNGDVEGVDDAAAKIKQYGVDGVLIGRAAKGNPWIFSGHKPNIEERKMAAIEHAKMHYKLLPKPSFPSYRKHLVAYINSMPNASIMRQQLMQATDPDAVRAIMTSHN